ncbi:Rad9-domain-containing protein [Phakopsora pachyrhizi]|uniref:Rad9-domain-containing protein n=1 Tax=Phakopsora pachyrhizi TaxID=170000 RepID=A0AAV0ARK6_PHAPC|nr:Rad9-domain-containing protein [Phakopsora pachyrhizi]
MELSIPADSIREFTAVLKCFKSFSENLHINPSQSHLKLSAVSATRSTYAVSVFDRSYFNSFKFKFRDVIKPIEVQIKPIFKILSYHNSHTAIDSCFLVIETDDLDLLESSNRSRASSSVLNSSIRSLTKNRLTIKLRLKTGITKFFSIPYSNQNKNLYPIDSRAQNSPNSWICLSNYLKHWFDHFASSSKSLINQSGSSNQQTSVSGSLAEGVEEICFCYQDDGKVCLRTMSLMDQAVERNVILPKSTDIFSKGVRQLSTALTVESNVFEDYRVDLGSCPSPMIITVSMREVGSMIELGTVMGSTIDSGFSVGGRPVYFTLESQDSKMIMDFVLASTNGEELIQKRIESENHQLQRQKQLNEKYQREVTQDLSGSRKFMNDDQPRARNSKKLNQLVQDSSLNSERSRRTNQNHHGSDFNRPTIDHNKSQQSDSGAEQPLFREESLIDQDVQVPEEADDGDDEFDRMSFDGWKKVEAEAILQSQTRQEQKNKRKPDNGCDDDFTDQERRSKGDQNDQKLKGVNDNNDDEDDDDDDRLMPSQAPPKKFKWKLFDD